MEESTIPSPVPELRFVCVGSELKQANSQEEFDALMQSLKERVRKDEEIAAKEGRPGKVRRIGH